MAYIVAAAAAALPVLVLSVFPSFVVVVTVRQLGLS